MLFMQAYTAWLIDSRAINSLTALLGITNKFSPILKVIVNTASYYPISNGHFESYLYTPKGFSFETKFLTYLN